MLREHLPQIQYDPISRIIKLEKEKKEGRGLIAVCTAGTADIPVAEEAAQTAEYFGSKVERIYDVGAVSYTHLYGVWDREEFLDMDIGNKLRFRRTELNITRNELAKKVHVTPSAIANYENGISYPTVSYTHLRRRK